MLSDSFFSQNGINFQISFICIFFVLMIAIIAVTTLKASLILFGRKAGWSWVHFALSLRAPPQKEFCLSYIMYFEIWYMFV